MRATPHIAVLDHSATPASSFRVGRLRLHPLQHLSPAASAIWKTRLAARAGRRPTERSAAGLTMWPPPTGPVWTCASKDANRSRKPPAASGDGILRSAFLFDV